MASMLVLELSNTHTKRCHRSADGKIFLAYSELKYEAATGKTHWQQTLYWTWDKEFPEWCRDTLARMSDEASQAITNSVTQPARQNVPQQIHSNHRPGDGVSASRGGGPGAGGVR